MVGSLKNCEKAFEMKPRGGGGEVLTPEIAMDVWPGTRAPSRGIVKNAPIMGAKSVENPTNLDKHWVILKENSHFFTPSGGKISIKVPMIGAQCWEAKKAPTIGANFFTNPPIKATHP